jgi:hypothetical protein
VEGGPRRSRSGARRLAGGAVVPTADPSRLLFDLTVLPRALGEEGDIAGEMGRCHWSTSTCSRRRMVRTSSTSTVGRPPMVSWVWTSVHCSQLRRVRPGCGGDVREVRPGAQRGVDGHRLPPAPPRHDRRGERQFREDVVSARHGGTSDRVVVQFEQHLERVGLFNVDELGRRPAVLVRHRRLLRGGRR